MKQTVYINNCKEQLHITISNDKLGGRNQKILAIGYVPGNELLYLNDGTLVSDCEGTCKDVDCTGCAKRGACYAIDSFCQYPAKTVACVENTLQLKNNMVQHFADIDEAIINEKAEVVRHTESGEIISFEHFNSIVEQAKRFPTVKFYMYTKNYPVLYKFFDTLGLELPSNMVVLISIWGDYGVEAYEHLKHHNNIKAFVVNNPKYTGVRCPAYIEDVKTLKNGTVKHFVRRVKEELDGKAKADAVKCGNCRLCTSARGCKVITCLQH